MWSLNGLFSFSETFFTFSLAIKKGNKGHFTAANHVEVIKQVASLITFPISVTVLGDGEFDSCELQELIEKRLGLMLYEQQKTPI